MLLRQFSDTRSLFLGMFIAILSVEIYCWLEGRKGAEDQDAGYRAAQRLGVIFRAGSRPLSPPRRSPPLALFFIRPPACTCMTRSIRVVQQPLERVVQSLPGILLLMFVAQSI